MKRILLIALALLGTLSVQAHLQDSTKRVKLSPEQKAEKLTQRMKKQLNLTDSQTIQVRAINLEHAQAVASLKSSTTKGQERKAQMDKLKQSYHTQLSNVLTTEQMEKFKKQVAKAKKKAKKKNGNDPAEEDDESDD